MATTLNGATLLAAGAVLLLWLVVAGWAVVRGLAMQRRSAYAARRAGQLSAMLETAIVQPLVVRDDGSVEGMQTAARMLGLTELPATLDALIPTLEPMDVAQSPADVNNAVIASQRTGAVSAWRLRVGEGRIVNLAMAPAPPQIGSNGSALLWLSDVTDLHHQQQQLATERDAARTAFEALSRLVDGAPMPVCLRDSSGGIQFANSAYVAASGSSSADDVLHHQVELLEPHDGVSARDAALLTFTQGKVLARRMPVTIGTQRRAMEVVDVPLGDLGIASFALDRQQEETLAGEYRRFADARRSMLDQMSAAVAEFAPDRSLRFVNRPFLALFGLTQEWASEAPLFERSLDKLRDNQRTPEVRDFPGWRTERRGWFLSREMVEESWMLRDGTHLRVVAQPTPDGGLLLVVEDRTEQVQLASARDTLLRVRTATFDNLFEAVAVFSPDGRLNLWNQRFRQLWNLPEDLFATHPRLDKLLERIAERLENSRQSAILSQMIMGATSERQQRSGRIGFADGRQFDFAAIPLPDGNALFTLIDVTDSRRIERALRERADALETADRVKTDFLSRVSYELRTPLTSIGGFAQLLAGGYAGDLSEAAQGYVRAIVEAADLLGAQIDTVLDLAQSEAGALPLERRTLSVVAILRDAVTAAQGPARAASVVLDEQIKAALGNVAGDAKRLRQVFDQLLAAAIAGFDGQPADADAPHRIQIVGDGDREAASIIIADNGPGVPPAGAHAVATALSRQLVEGHGGSFEPILRAGEGALIAIKLPR